MRLFVGAKHLPEPLGAGGFHVIECNVPLMFMPANPNHATTLIAVLAASLEAAAFGVLAAGLLLWSRQINLSFIHVESHWLARLIFLLAVGGAFGLIAGITPMLSRIVAELRRKP